MPQPGAPAVPVATPSPPLERRWEEVTSRATRWCPPPVAVLVVVPHPDDEVLGTGGLIAHQRALGIDVTVVAVTDGEAAYGPDLGFDLAARRRGEQLDALAELGVAPDAVVRLGLPDGRVAEHEGALAEAVADLAPDGSLVVSPSPLDHHCDHEAVGRAATQAAGRRALPIVHSLFWAWHHRTPRELAGATMLALPLDDDLRRRRWSALARHRSQVTDDVAPRLLGDEELVPFAWGCEHYLAPSR